MQPHQPIGLCIVGGLVGVFMGYAVAFGGEASASADFVRDPIVLLVVGAVIGWATTHAYHLIARRDALKQQFQNDLQANALEHEHRGGTYEYKRGPDGERTGVALGSEGRG